MGVALCVAAMVCTFARPAAADQYTDQISADQQQQAQVAQAIAAAKNQADQLQRIVTSLDAQIATTQSEVTAEQAQLQAVQADLAAHRESLRQRQAELAADRKRLARDLVIIYELQQQSTPLKNLLASGNFNDFWTSLLDTRRISANERQQVDAINLVRLQIQNEVDSISAREQQETGVLAALYTTQHKLTAQRSLRQSAINWLRRQERQGEAALATLNAEIKKLQAEEAAALAAGGGNGQFAWPDSGPISQGFGCTPFLFEPYDPNCSTLHFHSGIDIAGACGNNIYAADAGIAYAEPFMAYGYGNYVIIVHGNGWESLYGHMSGFAIGNGQTVHRGDLIGWEGSTGNSTGCHLHFGISRNNNWVNPLNFLG